jgi:hypothetical protein
MPGFPIYRDSFKTRSITAHDIIALGSIRREGKLFVQNQKSSRLHFIEKIVMKEDSLGSHSKIAAKGCGHAEGEDCKGGFGCFRHFRFNIKSL